MLIFKRVTLTVWKKYDVDFYYFKVGDATITHMIDWSKFLFMSRTLIATADKDEATL